MEYGLEVPPDRCAGCGEVVDRDEDTCRLCGEEVAAVEDLVEHPSDLELDELGSWSQLKHEIIEEYAAAYTTILSKQPFIKKYVYSEGFAGAGHAFDRDTKQLISTTARRILDVTPPFTEYHLIELNRNKAEYLANLTANRTAVHVHAGSCDEVLRERVIPRCRYRDFARGLCVLDPYGLTVSFDLLKTIAAEGSMEIVFNFMVVSANRNVLYSNRRRVSDKRKQLLDNVWGDRTWEAAAYLEQPTLFGDVDGHKLPTRHFVRAYCERLRKVAGFTFVPEPVPMRNDRGATLYYLIFAGHNQTGAKIVNHIFRKYDR